MAISTTPATERSEYRPLYGPSPRRATSDALGSRAMVKAWVPRKSTRPRMRSAIASVLRNAPSTYPGDDRKVSAAKLGRGAMRVLAAAIVLALAAVVGGHAVAAEPPHAALTLVGPPETVFASTKDACDGHDVPDAPVRAFRDAKGAVVLFGMHYQNRALRGESFDKLKLDCRIVLASSGKADPAAYDDKSWITATWTEDGARVEALLHHEYQANHHAGRCKAREYLACWYNTVLAVASNDGRASFPRAENSAGRRRRALPPGGRSTPAPRLLQPLEHRSRRGPALHVRGDDRLAWPAERRLPLPHLRRRRCVGLARLGRRAVLGALRRSLPQPRKAGPRLPPDRTLPGAGRRGGAASPERRLGRGLPGRRRWRPLPGARPLLRGLARPPRVGQAAAASRRQDPLRQPVRCERVHRLPVAPRSRGQGRNFDDVGDAAELYFATLRIEGCTVTSDRNLVRRKVAIKVWP